VCVVCTGHVVTPACSVPQLEAKARSARIARIQRRYHKVKFFERRKVERRLKKARRQLETKVSITASFWRVVTARSARMTLVDGVQEAEGAPQADIDAARAALEAAEADELVRWHCVGRARVGVWVWVWVWVWCGVGVGVCMHACAHHWCGHCPQYVNYYPKDKKYVSLFPNKNKDDPKMLKQYVASWQLRAVATLPARDGTPCAPDVRTCEPSAGTAQQRTHGVSCPTTTCLATSVGGTPTRSTRAASQTQ